MDGFVFWMTLCFLVLFGFIVFAMLTAVATRPGGRGLNVALVAGTIFIVGTFYRTELGKFRMYSRRANQTVLLVTTSGNVVVAPERRDEFIAYVRQEKGA